MSYCEPCFSLVSLRVASEGSEVLLAGASAPQVSTQHRYYYTEWLWNVVLVNTRCDVFHAQILYVKFPDDDDVLTVQAWTEDFKCAFISIQNNSVRNIQPLAVCFKSVQQCPVNDLLSTAMSRGIFQTMSTTAFLTVKVRDWLFCDRKVRTYFHCRRVRWKTGSSSLSSSPPTSQCVTVMATPKAYLSTGQVNS